MMSSQCDIMSSQYNNKGDYPNKISCIYEYIPFHVPFQFAMTMVWVIMESKVTMDIDSCISLLTYGYS